MSRPSERNSITCFIPGRAERYFKNVRSDNPLFGYNRVYSRFMAVWYFSSRIAVVQMKMRDVRPNFLCRGPVGTTVPVRVLGNVSISHGSCPCDWSNKLREAATGVQGTNQRGDKLSVQNH